MKTKSISLVLPMFNEIGYIDKTVSEAVSAIEQFMPDFEMIIVDDASNDGSEKIADILSQKDQRIKVIHHKKNKKLGGVLKTGFSAASKETVIYTDMDMPFDFSRLKEFLSLTDVADIVNGYRTDYKESFKRRLYSKVYNAFIKALFGLKVKDVNFAMKIFNKRILNSLNLKSEGSFINAEALIKAQYMRYRIKEVPVCYRRRNWGYSRLSSLSVIIKIIYEMLKFLPEATLLRLKMLKNNLHIFVRRHTCPFKLIQSYIPKEGDIYDFGCGHGIFINYLSSFLDGKCIFIGFDIDNDKIKIAASINRSRNMRFELKDITKASGIVNAACITMIDVLMFMPLSEQENLLKKCFNYLSEKGILIIKEIDTRPLHKYLWHQIQETLVLKLFRLIKGKGIYCRPRKNYEVLLKKIGYKVNVVQMHQGYLYPHILYVCAKTESFIMKKKVLLLNPPANDKYIRDFYCSFSSKTNYYWPPQDLLGISGVLRQDYEVEVLDAISLKLGKEACYHRIINSSAFALIFTTGTVSLDEDLRFIERVKKNKNIKVIGSSSIFKFIGKDIMDRFPFLDALAYDFTTKGILDYLNGDFANCDYMIYRKGDKVDMLDKENANEFSIGIPLHELFVNNSNRIPMFRNSAFAVVITSIGCNFKCKFCIAGTMKLKRRRKGEVIEELKYLSKLGIKKIFFADPIFTADKNRVFEFCKNICKENIKIEWICNAHPATIQEENLLKKMKETGCKALMIGVESANDEILERYSKGTNVEQIRKVFRLCRRLKIKTLAYFIIGLPGESVISIQKTIDFSRQIGCDYASFGHATPDIGTELRKESLARGWFVNCDFLKKLDPSIGPYFKTEQLSEENAGKLLHTAYRKFYFRPSYIIKRLLEVKSACELKILLKGGQQLLKKNIL